jgi:hypothetical protein
MSAGQITANYAEMQVAKSALAIAIAYLGKPTFIECDEAIWVPDGGPRDAPGFVLVIDRDSEHYGQWLDETTGEVGGMAEFIARQHDIRQGDAVLRLAELEAGVTLTANGGRSHGDVASYQPAIGDEFIRRETAAALRRFSKGVPFRTAPAAMSYLKRLGLGVDHIGRLDIAHCLRWLPDEHAFVALMSGVEAGEAVGVQTINLDGFGHVQKRQFQGRRGPIMLRDIADVEHGLAVAIGLDDALRASMSGLAAWAMPDAGSLAMLAVLPDVSITIHASRSQMAAAGRCADRWRETQNTEVAIVETGD